jgi:hypothetical protein
MAASLLLDVSRLVSISATQVPHPDTGSPTTVIVTARSADDCWTLAGNPPLIRAALQAAIEVLDAADPTRGDWPTRELAWPPRPARTPARTEVAR